jgi:hypothetical protein
MPILSSLGALSYIKTNITGNNDYNYWYTELANSSIFTSVFFNNNNVFIGGSIQRLVNNNQSQILLIKNYDTTQPAFIYSSILNNTTSTTETITNISNSSFANNYIILNGTFEESNRNYGLSVFYPANAVPNATNQSTAYENLYGANTGQNVVSTTLATIGARLDPFLLTHIRDNNDGNRYLLYTDTDGPSERGRLITLANTANNNAFGNLHYSSNDEHVAVYNQYIIKFDSNRSNYYPILYQKGISDSSRLVSCNDSNANNIIIGSDSGILGKIEKSSGNILWAKNLSNVNITCITENNNIFVTGNKANNIYIGEFDANGNNIWQNEFSGKNFNTYSCTTNQNVIYVVGENDNRGFALRIPADGNIPGNGIYDSNLSYFTSNVSISNSNVNFSNTALSSANNLFGINSTLFRNRTVDTSKSTIEL